MRPMLLPWSSGDEHPLGNPTSQRKSCDMIDDHDYDDQLDGDCPNCMGEGYYYDCFEEWACIDPEGGCDLCRHRCDWCQP